MKLKERRQSSRQPAHHRAIQWSHQRAVQRAQAVFHGLEWLQPTPLRRWMERGILREVWTGWGGPTARQRSWLVKTKLKEQVRIGVGNLPASDVQQNCVVTPWA